MMAFHGFSTDNLIGLPPELFTEVLPAVTLASELKVTLHAFHVLSQQRGTPRRLSWDTLAHDRVLHTGLRALSRVRLPLDMLAEGLEAAVQRRTLLHLAAPNEGRVVNWYLANTAANCVWVAQAQQTQVALDPASAALEPRPSLFALYEQNIGPITPLLVDELREAEERYALEWIEDAMREAVAANARSWRYIRKVLERWALHGRQDAPHRPARYRMDQPAYANGHYQHLLHRRNGTHGID